jgi:hypothetical protein
MARVNPDGSRTPLTMPNHKKLKRSTLRTICSQAGIPRDDFGERFKTETRLHDLPSTKTNPFNSFDDIEDGLQFFETAIVNFAILRNYFAHHSCLDYEIISSDWALDPIEAMLLVLLTALEVFEPVESE